MEKDDHYVAQTYLRRFVGPDGKLVPYYKNGHVIVGKSKVPKAICFESGGNTNKYFPNQRLVEDFLPAFENSWNNNIEKLESGILDANMKFEISGYIAYLRTCTPTAKRIGQENLAGLAKPYAYKVMKDELEKANYLSDEHKGLITKELQQNKISLKVDRAFAHAQNMITLQGILYQLYCSRWGVLINNSNTPFVTSDNPAILYYRDPNQQIAHTYIPLKSNMALLIIPDINIMRPSFDDVEKYDNSQDMFGVIKPARINEFNRYIIKSAEKLVIHHSKEYWLEKLVRRYGNWYVKSEPFYLPTEKGTMTIIRIKPVKKTVKKKTKKKTKKNKRKR